MKTKEKKQAQAPNDGAVMDYVTRMFWHFVRWASQWAWREEINYAHYVRHDPQTKYAMRLEGDDLNPLWYLTERGIPPNSPEGKTYITIGSKWRYALLPHIADGQWFGNEFIPTKYTKNELLTDENDE